MDADGKVTAVDAAARRVPTPRPEADGTLAWHDTTVVVCSVDAEGVRGTGWTYADAACVDLVRGVLADEVVGRRVVDVRACWHAMQRRIRNLGRPGLVSCALSAVDTALWDAAARSLGLPLSTLFGRVHDSVAVYGSGGFTSDDEATLAAQLHQWRHELGIPRVKIKIAESWGTEVDRDLHRVALARKVIGDDAELYVDANGGYRVGQARRIGRQLETFGVSWFEEPVSSDDLAGLRHVRDSVAADVAAGEYGYDLASFARLIGAGAVDCVQVDVTRCGGYTEWFRIAALAAAHNLEVSAHCAPNLTVPAAVATPNFRHIEWFADHARIEPALFDGAVSPAGGHVRPHHGFAGHGLTAAKSTDTEEELS